MLRVAVSVAVVVVVLVLVVVVVVWMLVVWTLVIPCSSLALPRIDQVSWLDFSQCRGPVTPRVTSYGPECFQVHHHLHHHDHLDQLQTPVTSSWKAGQRLAHLAGSTRISTSKPRVGIRKVL